ncbi:MAG: hypothetical protein HZB54_09065 [Deltaproteobacteria bacterium]|nr:hypothetical protein [Deltaproteobacteria bacterium]
MENQLLLLKKIQDIDMQIGLIEQEARETNADVVRLSAEVKEFEDGLEAINGELAEIENMKLSLEGELAECTERVKKNEERLKNIKNDKEFKASTKEINAAKKGKLTKEGEINKLNEKISEKKGAVKEGEDKLNNKKAELEAKESSIETNNENWEKKIKEKKEEKASISKDVSPSLLKKYETIREKRQGIAIISVVGGTCQGCHMNIPPQAYIQLQKGSSDLIFCPHCHRILYWNSIAKAQEQGKGQPA